MGLFSRRRSQCDFEDEISAHIDLETDRLIADGMSAHDAQSAARRRVGNIGAAQERFHEARGWAWAEHLMRDGRAVVFSAAVALVAGIGTGLAPALSAGRLLT